MCCSWGATVLLLCCLCLAVFQNHGCQFCTAWRWPFWPVLPPGGGALQSSLVRAGAWRLFWRGQAVVPVFASFFDFHVIVALVMASPSNPKRMKTSVGNPSKGQKRKERIYSHHFLTKDNEDRFQVVMQRKLVAERKVILKPGEVNEFQLELMRRGWERLGSYPSTYSVTLVKEFYANAKVTTSAAPTFLSYVRGKRVPFDADTINEFLGTQLADDVECQFSLLEDEGVAPGELLQALCLAGEGFHRGTIQRGSLHPLARFWSAFVHANISPCSHVSDLTEGRATILYTILTGRVMDVGQFIANEIHRCANAAGKAALGHPSLITHLCSLAGVDISVPPLEKATQDLDFSYFQSCAGRTAARSDTLAQVSLSRLSEIDRDSPRPFAQVVAQAVYHRFEREDASLRREDLA
ncbi:hypothetical protein DEO72_LG2g4405 [Vigna unguiculata]|uniref:Putative plant transposon protein domain-containing protein n=1 Tax=Vigna unguiculata TaxID=3917 RepID=A0A4D6L6J3_VIGUN|nr:hypothetical protein DEO72_LG2g4405 [Vigna unguiculata]